MELAKRISRALHFDLKVEGHVQRRDALPGADYVYCFLAVNSKEAWKKEFELCNKHGINPYEAYTVGAPGLNFSIRHVPVMDQGQLIGIVSIGDVVKAQLDQYEGQIETLHTQLNEG